MKFKKLDTKAFAILHHYTPSQNVKSILETGLNGVNTPTSYFRSDVDKIKDVHFQDTLDKIQKRNDRYGRLNNQKRLKFKADKKALLNQYNVSNTGELFDKVGEDTYEKLMKPIQPKYRNSSGLLGGFRNEKLPAHYRQLSLMDGFGGVTDRGGDTNVKNRNQVRLVTNISDDQLIDNPDGLPYETRSRAIADPKNIRVQLPFGAVTQSNSQTYLNDLKDIDPSKFDVNDTYTRRIYNLWAKKNNKPLLPGSENFRNVNNTQVG